MTSGMSETISLLCAYNDVKTNLVNYSITNTTTIRNPNYDIYPILDGVNTACLYNLEECGKLFLSKYHKDIFQGKVFVNGIDYKSIIIKELIKLDENMSKILNAFSSKNEISNLNKFEKKNEQKTFEPILRLHDNKFTDSLNRLASNRNDSDSKFIESILELQKVLQDELQEIISLREDIGFTLNHEAIMQFVSLFSLTHEILKFHPNYEDQESYNNLIESLEDLLCNIEQSIAMLGVTVINDVGKIFDTLRHKIINGLVPSRFSKILKVIKVGFIYKTSVLEKAEVFII
jgi:molecular chaperone GrpE (heat shock protein)